MSRKPESQFIDSVHRHMPPVGRGSYHMKNHNPYNGGIADVWYSGKKRDLWIEYKFVAIPKRGDTLIDVELSALQFEWLSDRLAEGRKAWVIVGSKEGGVLVPQKDWSRSIATSEFRRRLEDRESIAAKIVAFIN